MEKKRIIWHGGLGNKKSWDQAIEILASLASKKSVQVCTLDRKKYEDRFFQITGHRLTLEKIKDENHIYQASLTPKIKTNR